MISPDPTQTLTGVKFLVVAEPKQAGCDQLLDKIYELYSDYALKNPFYSLEMPIRYYLSLIIVWFFSCARPYNSNLASFKFREITVPTREFESEFRYVLNEICQTIKRFCLI